MFIFSVYINNYKPDFTNANMALEILKKQDYAESSITFIGLTKEMYGRHQYILVDSDDGKNPKLKFPGLRFRAPTKGKTLEDVAAERFEEQTGLKVTKNLGLRAVIQARSRHDRKWIFRNIFAGIVDGTPADKKDERNVYVADAGHGLNNGRIAYLYNRTERKVPLDWVTPENQVIADLATNLTSRLDWENGEAGWMKRIPLIGVEPQTDSDERKLGCGLAVSSIFLVYRPDPAEEERIVMVKRWGDKYPGYAGGKIETPKDIESSNIDPVSCCAEEGEQELGFRVITQSLIGVACTPINMPSEDHHNSIITYAFLARPVNPLKAEHVLKGKPPEEKMERYFQENYMEHRDRISRKELRMPDMLGIGDAFLRTDPLDRISLTQIYDSGVK